MAEDIIFSAPWQCGDRDCAQQWHLSNWWVYDDGSYTEDKYADGDHEDREESEVPTPEAVKESWAKYWRYVSETGEDPLHQIMLPHQSKVKRQWQCRYRNSIAGVLGIGLRPRARGSWLSPHDVPAEVLSHFLLTPRPGANQLYEVKDFKNVHQMYNDLSSPEKKDYTIHFDKRQSLLITAMVELDPPPLSDERAKAFRRKVARQALKEKTA